MEKNVSFDNYGKLCPFTQLELKHDNDLMFIVNIGLNIRRFFSRIKGAFFLDVRSFFLG